MCKSPGKTSRRTLRPGRETEALWGACLPRADFCESLRTTVLEATRRDVSRPGASRGKLPQPGNSLHNEEQGRPAAVPALYYYLEA